MMIRRSLIRLLTLGVFFALGVLQTGTSSAGEVVAGAHITSQTTTTLVSAVSGQTVAILSGTACVDANGAATALTWQDSNGTNLAGTSVVYVLNPGQCQEFRRENFPAFGAVTGKGFGLQVVTGTGNGPVEVNLRAVQQ